MYVKWSGGAESSDSECNGQQERDRSVQNTYRDGSQLGLEQGCLEEALSCSSVLHLVLGSSWRWKSRSFTHKLFMQLSALERWGRDDASMQQPFDYWKATTDMFKPPSSFWIVTVKTTWTRLMDTLSFCWKNSGLACIKLNIPK